MKPAAALALSTALALAVPVRAQDYGSARQAEAMTRRAVQHVAAVGTEQAAADFTQKKAEWCDRDLYVVMLSSRGTVLAHASNARLVGKEMMEVKDVDGTYFAREMVESARRRGKGWTDYKFTDPMTGKVLPKSSYCEQAGTVVVCVGIYKR